MTKKTLTGIMIFLVSIVILGAAETATETLVPTSLGPPAAISLAATPLPAPFDLKPAEPAVDLTSPALFPKPSLALGRSADPGKTFFDVNLVALVALNIADYVTTREALKYSGLSEINPLMKPFVNSPAAFAAIKIGTTALTYWSFKALFKSNRTMAWILTTATNVLLSYVVANNIQQISRAKIR
jgi:hypothetical protein